MDNLLETITTAQTAARRAGNYDWRDVQPWQVWEQMSREAQAAYEATTLPRELLITPASRIREYAERCGIEL